MPRKDPQKRFLRNLAAAFVSTEWIAESLLANAERATGKAYRWIVSLIRRLLKRFPVEGSFESVLEFLKQDRGVRRFLDRRRYPVRTIFVPPSRMALPPKAIGPVTLPPITTEAGLADWLGISIEHLLWYADPTGRNAEHPEGPLRPYRYRWLKKTTGAVRLLEIPKHKLKLLQRQILAGILNHMPVHDAAHGFVANRSIITNANRHCGKPVVLRFDLADFFPSISATRIVRTFRTFGYPERIARLLMGLCTTRLPRDVWAKRPVTVHTEAIWTEKRRLTNRHLPQGAPTSPALANLVAFRLDHRLARLAAKLEVDYTRYADDLTFSGGEILSRQRDRMIQLIGRIVLDEGFRLNQSKTCVMTQSQRQFVAGVVVNVRPNIPRGEFDQLKAMLTNCRRHGVESQNREHHLHFRAHLEGRIAQVAAIHLQRGRKLWELFTQISWPTE